MVLIKYFLKTKIALLWVILVAIVLCLFYFGFSMFNGQKENTQSYSVVKYIEQANETVLLNVGIQSIETKANNSTIPWTKIGIPLTEKKAIIILNYQAKLGIKKAAKIDKVSDNSYTITLPKYEVIGIALDKDAPYQLYDESGELLSYSTSNVDTGKLVTNKLSSKKQETYLKKYKNQMDDSAKLYYKILFISLNENVKLDFKFEK